jgi:hypothetical protein
LRAIELQLEEVKRRVPPEFDPEAEERFIRGVAKVAEVPVEVRVVGVPEILRHEDGSPSPIAIHRLDVSGRADLQKIEIFVEDLAKRSWRAGDLDSLRLDRDGRDFRFTARLALPTMAPLETSPGLARQRSTLALITNRLQPARLTAAGDLLADVPDDEGVHVTQVRIGEGLTMQGVVIGSAARGYLGGAFEDEILIAPGGGPCRPFVVPAAPIDPAVAALCVPAPQRSLGAVAVRGNGGPLTIRLREIEAGGVFYVLHDLTGESFVVDSNVKGLMNVDVEAATLDETLRAMRSVGLAVSAGPLRRVSLVAGGRPPAAAADYTGEPVSLAFQDASVRSVLCLFSHLSGLTVIAPAGLADRTTLYAKELPWDRAMTELIASAGLRYSIDGTRVLVGDERPGLDACESVEEDSSRPFTQWRIPLVRSGRSDLKLAGVARMGDAWRAYAFVPWRWIAGIDVGQELFDGHVSAVGEQGFELANVP